ncbi:MAG: Ig-like domain-containing protein, partial [Actinomycetes bacterium]
MEPDLKPHRRGTAKKVLAVTAVCVLAAVGGVFAAVAPGLANGTLDSEAGSALRTTPGIASPVVPPVAFDAAPANGAKQVNPAAPVSLKVANGTIQRVTLAGTNGKTVDGSIDPAGTAWSASGPLEFNTEYSYTYVVKDAAGRETSTTQS